MQVEVEPDVGGEEVREEEEVSGEEVEEEEEEEEAPQPTEAEEVKDESSPEHVPSLSLPNPSTQPPTTETKHSSSQQSSRRLPAPVPLFSSGQGRGSPPSFPTVAEGLQEAGRRAASAKTKSKKSKPRSTKDLLPLHQDVGRSNKQLLEPSTPDFKPTPEWVCHDY